jgi:uncharacterized membrane protein YqhA
MRNFRPCLYFWKSSMDHATHSSAAIRQKLPRMTQIMGLTRWFSVVVVLSSLVGALLMFVIGASNTAEAVLQYLEMMPVLEGAADAAPVGKQASPRVAANLQLLESLDNGLTGLTFLYFAYGIYSLFLTNTNTVSAAPRWLKVENIASLKKTLMEVVAVLLAIMFVRVLAEKILLGDLHWELLTIPISITAIALGTRLMFSEGPVSSSIK